MIPKIVHYVWLGFGQQSETIQRCIQSWKQNLPDYEIKCWNESNYSISKAPLFVQEAYNAKKWAFASDYIRLWALKEFGGIYLDTDVEVLKPLDVFLDDKLFIGTQSFLIDKNKKEKELKVNLSIGVIGAEKNHIYINDCLSYFNKISISKGKNSIDTTVSNYKMANILMNYGYKNIDERQSLREGIEVYTTSVFGDRLSPTPKENCYTFHWGEMSWFQPKPRGLFYKLCWNLNLMKFYHWIETIRK